MNENPPDQKRPVADEIIAGELLNDHPETARAHLQRWMANRHDYLHV